GAGFPRAAAILRALDELGYAITIYPTAQHETLEERPVALQNIEVVRGGVVALRAFLQSGHAFDLVLVSRPHNMRYVKAAIGSELPGVPGPVVYDAEAIFAMRDVNRMALLGRPLADRQAALLVD